MSTTKMERKNILWLVSWYPNKIEPFDGDFIQRHAKAAAIYHNIHVVFVKGVEGKEVHKSEMRQITGLTEEVLYYNKEKSLLSKTKTLFTWRRLYRQAIKRYVSQNGAPHLVHVHIPWKAGLIAFELKTRFGWKYIVTEHWGIYNKKVTDNITTKPWLVQQLWKKVIKEAESLTSVSDYVGKGINKYLIKKPFTIIPNVVDTSLFYFSEEKHTTFTFIHVSNMVPLKNVSGILTAFYQLVHSGCDNCRLILIGNQDDTYIKKARALGLLHKQIFFKNEIPYAAVAAEMRQAHCLIVNSNIENAPCVISEALCCGLPVIATKVGGIPEVVNKENGILIKPKSEKELSEAMQNMLINYPKYENLKIAKAGTATFGYSAIAEGFAKLYKRQ